jgi:hypothetical protein
MRTARSCCHSFTAAPTTDPPQGRWVPSAGALCWRRWATHTAAGKASRRLNQHTTLSRTQPRIGQQRVGGDCANVKPVCNLRSETRRAARVWVFAASELLRDDRRLRSDIPRPPRCTKCGDLGMAGVHCPTSRTFKQRVQPGCRFHYEAL